MKEYLLFWIAKEALKIASELQAENEALKEQLKRSQASLVGTHDINSTNSERSSENPRKTLI